MINSPLINNGKTLKVKSISADNLIKQYQKNLSIDVSRFFKDENEITQYKCLSTDYMFFHPESLIGDGIFYKQIQENSSNYYTKEKWEFNVAFDFINPIKKVLEIGSGSGEFLTKLKSKNIDHLGLDFNELAIANSLAKGLNAKNESFHEHSLDETNKYGTVISFQLLEHIYDVNSYINSCIKLLENNGKLIISVPNNDSFIKYDSFGILNLPPHHIGFWNKKSLSSLPHYFPLKLEKILEEPLAEYNIYWYYSIMKKMSLILSWLPEKIALYLIHKFRGKIKGQTIMAVYSKL